ncbi:quercetin 2,3-dioxygenase [Microdochium nivale]|nr:quercetin 2,3-dioxygenase [Microdochium nivale]
MKLFSITLSIIVAIISTIVYKEQITQHLTPHIASLDLLITKLKNNNYLHTSLPSAAEEQEQKRPPPTTPEPSSSPSRFYNPASNQQDLPPISTMSTPRGIAKVLLAHEQAEGAGARVRRSIGTPQLRNLSPFLMLDHATVGPGAGFPDHPHRGMETITYVLSGAIDHEDFAGNRGTIEQGDLQFMTAGKGIVHAEMPRAQADGSPNVAMQLWVDLPRDLKGCDARYRDLRASEIPQVELDDGRVSVKVISGVAGGVESLKDLAYTPVWWLDVTVQPGGRLAQAVPRGWNAFAYQISGTSLFGERGVQQRPVGQYHNCVFDREGDVVHVEVAADAAEPSRFVLIAGQVLDQPVVQYGPFVVSSQEEVRQAFFDYQTHSNGFERARDWESEIGKSMKA